MTPKSRYLTAGEAARALGISAKALRIYERHGLIAPGRTPSGWRSYGAAEMKRAAEIVELRSLGLALVEIGAILGADRRRREILLEEHRLRLGQEKRRLDAILHTIGSTQAGPPDTRPGSQDARSTDPALTFSLPWPWDGEPFALAHLPALGFITGPLGSGKTRLAMKLADALPGGRFLGLDRLTEKPSAADPLSRKGSIPARGERIIRLLVDAGASRSHALTILIETIYSATPIALVVDMVEQDLDQATQEALIHVLRRNPPPGCLLFLMTRSSSILDLSKTESGETIIYCPANHSPPLIAHADPLCPGYEAVATCLASPAVRARTAGVIAVRTPRPHGSNNDSRETIC